MHTKATLSLTTIFVVVIALMGCTPTDSPSASDSETSNRSGSEANESVLTRIESSGVVKICTTGDYRPFTYHDPKAKKWSGIDIDMGRALAESLEAKAKFVKIDWDEFPHKLQQRACDVGMGGLSITTERAAQLFMSDPTAQDGKPPPSLCARTPTTSTRSPRSMPKKSR